MSASQARQPTFQPTLLVFVPKSFGPSQEDTAVENAESMMVQTGVKARCISSAAWFKQSFPQHGNWDTWIWETVHGRDYTTRTLNFHGFVVVGKDVGRATASIVKTALQSARVVLAMVDDTLYAVTDVAEQDNNRWSNGWTLVLAAIGE